MKLLKTNDKIRSEISTYNNEFAHILNGVILSFTGSRIKGYSLYFKAVDSGLITCTITGGNEKNILHAIQTLWQFSGSRQPIIKRAIC
ncbi:MAG: hypothetical protein ABIP51_23695 [Bacteroidia bacterium]